ncbi:MAG: hypothetical protein A2086_05980 [Spirochaetes bacterium GWD1_27_9]|nr:MAG: hypothetical protein A2Z98_10640 [Spirochaetes bacterium GWB1_27_13]OHD26217.1 MAG: hypothetical protein A2Y34_11165 [Spirochaetes bacterium GWC1_27_15]OHD35561.1 MAG: hypothetical protein A2086_05980 [Spirochaetes bacterium GWD1_27_9]
MYYLVNYSIKNLTRNKRRTFLTLFAIFFAVAILIIGNAYFSGVVNDIISLSVRESGHIVIQKKSFTKKERMNPLDENIENLDTLISILIQYKEIKIATPRINVSGLFIKNDKSYTSRGYAFDEIAEKETLKLEDSIVLGSYFASVEKEIIIGLEIAKELNVKVGEVITFLSRDVHGAFTGGKFKIMGIADFKTNQANRIFYIRLENAYKMLKNRDNPQKVICVLNNFNDIKEIKAKLLKNQFIKENSLDVFGVNEIGFFQSIFKVIGFIVPLIFTFFLLIATVAIANTMMMTVLERTKEIGVLQAIGLKAKFVALTFIFESLTIGIIGSLIGAAIGTPIALFFQKYGVNIGESVTNGMPVPMKSIIYPLLRIEDVILFVFIGIFISFIAGVIPAVRALRLNPAIAIRE